jgi:hypothetical protein
MMDSTLFTYLWLGCTMLVIGLMCLLHTEDPRSVKLGARLMLAAPVWPLAAAALAAWLLYKLMHVLVHGVRSLFLIAFNKHPDWR